jgi:cold-inducible RNA-binding protein
MRPAPQISAPDVWMVREQACFKLWKPLFESIRTRSFERQPFRRSPSDSQLLFTPHRGKVYIEMSTKLYVGNLAFQTTSQDLQELFGQAGTVQSASIVEDRETGRSRGFAFVEMSTNAEAAAAIDQFNGKELGGRALKVNEAKPRENRGGGGGGGRGFNNNRGGYRGGNNSGGGRREPREPRW